MSGLTVENISIDVKTNAGNAASQFRSLSEAIRSVSNAASSVRGANSGASSSMNDVSSSARSAASSSRSAARAIDDVSKSAKKAQAPMGSFAASLKRIAYYRLLRTILKEIAQALKEGLENVYEWSKAGGDMGQIAGALDRISSAGAQLKNQLGAAFGELLAALEPVIVTLLNLLTQLAQALTWVIALLSGKGYYPVAKQIAKDWKEADKAAGGYKNTILGFDEINRLNDTGGGGGSGLGGEPFDWEPIEFVFNKTYEWLSRFKDDIDSGIAKINDFVAELLGIPELIPVEVVVKVPDPLPDPLLAFESLFSKIPVVEIEFAILGNPIPLIRAIRSAIAELVADAPSLQNAFQTAVNAVVDLIGSLNESYAENVQAITAENSTLGQDVIDTYNRLKNPLDGWISHMWEKVGEYQQACGALAVENETLASDMQTTFESIKVGIQSALESVKTNFNTFTTQTLPAWGAWAQSVAESAHNSFENIAQNVYNGLQNAADNIVSFVNGTAQGFVSWARNTAESVWSWASNILTNIGNALKSAWESIKDFASATGAAIGGFFKENASVIVPVAIGAAVVAGAILLAPPTGGASLAAIALAANGGSFPNDGSLFVAGEAGPEIVADMGSRTGVMNVDQMEAAVANGNIGVINAVYAMANMIVKAVNEIDPDIQLDGQSLADKMYHYNQQAGRRYGVAMVT